MFFRSFSVASHIWSFRENLMNLQQLVLLVKLPKSGIGISSFAGNPKAPGHHFHDSCASLLYMLGGVCKPLTFLSNHYIETTGRGFALVSQCFSDSKPKPLTNTNKPLVVGGCWYFFSSFLCTGWAEALKLSCLCLLCIGLKSELLSNGIHQVLPMLL